MSFVKILVNGILPLMFWYRNCTLFCVMWGLTVGLSIHCGKRKLNVRVPLLLKHVNLLCSCMFTMFSLLLYTILDHAWQDVLIWLPATQIHKTMCIIEYYGFIILVDGGLLLGCLWWWYSSGRCSTFILVSLYLNSISRIMSVYLIC